MNRIVFLMGHDRSGRSWIGSILGSAKNSLYLHEPLNEDTSRNGNWSFWNFFPDTSYPNKELEKIYDLAIRGKGVRRLKIEEKIKLLLNRCTIVIKETGGMLLGEWLQSRYGGNYVIIFRHPAPVILSNIAMGKSNAAKWADQLLNQETVRQRREFERLLRQSKTQSIFEQFLAVYCIRYKILLEQLSRNPNWISLFYEEVCLNTELQFRDVFKKLGLIYTRKASNMINKTTHLDNSSDFFGTFRVSEKQVNKWKPHINNEMKLKMREIMYKIDFPIYNQDKDWET